MFNPVSTYRVQFNKEFTFSMLEERIPLLERLGIRTLYASPVFKAVAGSTHGYDVVNPFEINPEIGTIEQLRRLSSKLKAVGIGWIQDIVPNHMAFHHTNPWLMDVLEKGSLSVYASVFDVMWAGDFFHGRLMVPFLGEPLENLVSRGEIQVVLWEERLCLNYSDQYYPVNTRTYGTLLSSDDCPESVSQFVEQLDSIHHITEPIQYALRWHELLMQFYSLVNEQPDFFQETLDRVNEDREGLLKVCGDQFYRLCYWKETEEHINYRRFFLVNGLICLNMQSEKVFHLYHELIGALVKDGTFQGIRVDHIDGLFDPTGYLDRLRTLCGDECYIVVEKILEPGEKLIDEWSIEGSSGYDFLGLVNNVFTRSSAENKFSSFYKSLTGDGKPIASGIREKKAFILSTYMKGELENLCRFFSERNPEQYQTVDPTKIREAIAAFMIEIPVYRYYGRELPLAGTEREEIGKVFDKCVDSYPALGAELSLLRNTLLENSHEGLIDFYQRCMQFSGPLMAKGVEDTLMYTYHRFLAHNEVGDSPEFFGLTVQEFHQTMQERQRRWPLAMNATSTHDTKRGEDARMRLNVLPDVASKWVEQVKDWIRLNAEFKTNHAPDVNDEYFIYQTLIGVFPLQREDDFEDRLRQYFTKALREAKRFSDWTSPDEAYEEGVLNFIHGILDPDTPFMQSFLPFHRQVADFGMINSLAQVTLKLTCPGVPDTYQGTWDWDLSLVDPDNRRPVDYEKLGQSLDELDILIPHRDCIEELWENRRNGQIKLWITRQLLQARSQYHEVFAEGEYVPLEVEGRYSTNCMAFARRKGKVWILVIVPLSMGRLRSSDASVIGHDWQDTQIVLPAHMPTSWKSLLHKKSDSHEGYLSLSEVVSDFPIAVLAFEDAGGSREAGILLAISSLPSKFGAGDLGVDARKFADFLSHSRQRIWQLLPLNPVDHGSGWSPYSSFSAMAGNPILISLEDLAESGLLDREELLLHEVKNRGVADYKKAEAIRGKLLTKAWHNFQKDPSLQEPFRSFVHREGYWLEDFALFQVLKTINNNQPWFQWPEKWKNRDVAELKIVTLEHTDMLDKLKWIQFIFFQQWSALRHYCEEREIRLLGDLPFYISHDSADVWANRDIFKLDADGQMVGIAGVLPDYFSTTGQLWNMPVFNWEKLKENGYEWWIRRLAKNLELYDQIRLDHFRAFVNFWEVPQGESTAINGKWMDGPGRHFFDALRESFGKLPFVAEDLGEVNDDVFHLRDELALPGMKVLHFAFGRDMAQSSYVPHHHEKNFVVYTGTHDNNTTKGWYKQDLGPDDRKRIERYLGRSLSASTIAEEMIRVAYASVANTAIVPMQDHLLLDSKARINTPSKAGGNWTWRMHEIPDEDLEEQLAGLVRIYGR